MVFENTTLFNNSSAFSATKLRDEGKTYLQATVVVSNLAPITPPDSSAIKRREADFKEAVQIKV